MASGRSQSGFFAHLKQHHIYQVAAAYGAAIAVLIPIVADGFPYFGWAGAVSAVIIALIAGLPVAVVLAWLLIKPAGHGRRVVWQRKHWILGAIVTPLVIAAVAVSATYAFRSVAQRAARLSAEQVAVRSDNNPATPVFNPPKDTLVVLPFKNLSGDPQQQYFSDGITEELTDALGQNRALRVMAWETAAHFRDNTDTPNAIGRQLNVANILHGSVAREGDEVRILVELVSSVTGLQLWSAHYGESFQDIFKVQDQVSQAIAAALQVRFAESDLPAGGTTNPEAHDLVLKGRALRNKSNAANLSQAREYFAQAIALDPGYADAHAELASTLIALTERSDLPLAKALPQARAEAEKALALDPRNAYAWTALGIADSTANPPDIKKAQGEFRKALMLDPSNASAHGDYGNVLPLRPGLAQYREAALLDPANEVAWNNVAVNAQDLGDWTLMAEAGATLLTLDPAAVDGAFTLAYANRQLGHYDQMVAAFDRAKPANARDREQIEAGRLVYRALTNAGLRAPALVALQRLAHYQADPDVAGNLLQMYLALGQQAQALTLLASYCPATPIGCNDLGISPIYHALHGDPRFERLVKKYNTVTVE